MEQFDFDCPQYYDFENPEDDSHPEEYFETRHNFDFSPSPKILSTINNYMPVHQNSFTSEEICANNGPSKNTRLSAKKQSLAMTDRPVRKVSSRFQPTKEPVAKKAKRSPMENFKKPAPVVKNERVKCKANDLKAKRRWKSCGSVLKRTVPEPFNFSTDKRIKSENQDKVEYKPLDFVSTLRSNTDTQQAPPSKVRPVPERLLRKRKVTACKTVGEQLLSFQQELSNRHNPSSPTDSKGGAKCPKMTLTQPATPYLRAKNRNRPLNILSHDEKENLEAEEMKKYHFKAQPVNPKILVSTGIKMPATKKVTAPLKVNLNTAERCSPRPRSKSLDRPPEFHARPVPWRILRGIRGLGKKIQGSKTQARTPHFALRKREEMWKQQEEAKEQATAAAAAQEAEKAKFKVPFTHVNLQTLETPRRELRSTVPAPFSFHERDQKKLARKEEVIQNYLEAMKPKDFKATPMPSPAVTGLPERKKISPTKIQSFNMELNQLGRNRADKWQKQMEEQMKKQEAMIFKAKPCTVTQAKPFCPTKPSKVPIEFINFNLHSVTRAALRSKFDQDLKEREEERQAELNARKLEENELAEKELAEQRARTVHKANPAPQHQPFIVKHGLKPSTIPVTPKFETEKRLKRKHE